MTIVGQVMAQVIVLGYWNLATFSEELSNSVRMPR